MVEKPDAELGRMRNFARRLIRESNRRAGSNVIKIGANETYNHARAKFEVCMKLISWGKEFYTEAIFESGGRADIFNLDDMTVIEILESESFVSCLNKTYKYPDGLKFEVAKMSAEGKLIWKTWGDFIGQHGQI